jgi:hypothetical protein
MACILISDKLTILIDNFNNDYYNNNIYSLTIEEKQIIDNDIKFNYLSCESLNILKKYIDNSNDEYNLKYYLNKTKLVFPILKQKIKDTSLEVLKRREYLKLRQEEREYNLMIHGNAVNPNVTEKIAGGNHYSSTKNQLTISTNMIVSIFAMFGICYYVGMRFSDSHTTCLIFGLVGAVVIMIVEMLLFIIRAAKMEHIYEGKITKETEILAQIRSSSLVTLSGYNNNNDGNDNDDDNDDDNNDNNNDDYEILTLDSISSNDKLDKLLMVNKRVNIEDSSNNINNEHEYQYEHDKEGKKNK